MKYLEELKNKNTNVYPVKQLVCTIEKNFNLERISSIKNAKSNLVFNSILNELELLNTIDTSFKDIIEEVIIWSDIAKVGTKEDRNEWKNKNYNLFSHNIGSSQIYKEYSDDYNEIVYILIKTHGLVGQYIQGEVNISSSSELYNIIEKKLLTKEELKEILMVLNECIIRDVSNNIYEEEKNDIEKTIVKIVNGIFDEKISVAERLCTLNMGISESDKNKLNNILEDKNINSILENLFNKCELWYYKASLKSFNIEEQIKVLLIISNNINNVKEIMFFQLMKNMYLDYKNIKRINIYKQRIIESYLDSISYEQIINNEIKNNINISYKIDINNDVLEFNFMFSKVAKKLIEFCEVAYNSGELYNKSVILLYDLFGFRKDNYDRFYNEIDYLKTMNSVINHKSKLLEFMVGNNILDVGPGGGALMDLILDNYKDKKVFGIDISSNVIDELNKKELREKRSYNLVKGNALYLEKYFQKGSIDTIIFSSIIHELFSYIDYDGKKFNYDTIKKCLISAYDIIPIHGRIIIRDGIMSSTNNKRIIEFKDKEDINYLKKYSKDFKGRQIKYDIIDDNKVIMNENDSMEFLYTYTWGSESYACEVQEQFGYFSKDEYEDFVLKNLNNSKIIISSSFLQSGYSEHLLNKINYYDENYNTIDLPNSTYILVIEKGE